MQTVLSNMSTLEDGAFPPLFHLKAFWKQSHSLLHGHGLGALHSAGRRRHGKPAAAHPAPPAHARTPPRMVEAFMQAVRRAEAASPPQERRTGGVPSPGQALADGWRVGARSAGRQVSISGRNAFAPAAAPAAAQGPAGPEGEGPRRVLAAGWGDEEPRQDEVVAAEGAAGPEAGKIKRCAPASNIVWTAQVSRLADMAGRLVHGQGREQ